ncbi:MULTISPECIES: protein YhfH [Bacillaceae]|uniref:YhfH family protein n=1 Tax=Domibacillus mangrovi TaxID=1714354 RepID=A0A1Q5P0R0_9BACI|nr:MULTISPECIES: protein YhfH [Bacillaceae]OKL35844.1 YhfH family protein [Domibacillus mangrovi]
MIKSIVEFFKNLPAKECANCGLYIEEQHDCYSNICPTCSNIKDI